MDCIGVLTKYQIPPIPGRYECNEMGHYKRNCTKRANGGRPGRGGAGAAGLAMMALVADGTPALGLWVMDSEASHHMKGEAELLTDAKQCAPVHILLADGRERVATRGCHGYIPEVYIRALYPYPLRLRAGDAYPKCIVRKGGEDISIRSDRNCKIVSDPYPRYESQDTGIYTVMSLPAPGEFWLNIIDLSFRVTTIAELRSELFGSDKRRSSPTRVNHATQPDCVVVRV